MNNIKDGGTAKNNRALFNTALRVIDDHKNTTLHEAKMQIAGLIEAERNVQCGFAGSLIGNGLNIVMKTDDYTASRAYYTNPVKSSSSTTTVLSKASRPIGPTMVSGRAPSTGSMR